MVRGGSYVYYELSSPLLENWRVYSPALVDDAFAANLKYPLVDPKGTVSPSFVRNYVYRWLVNASYNCVWKLDGYIDCLSSMTLE